MGINKVMHPELRSGFHLPFHLLREIFRTIVGLLGQRSGRTMSLIQGIEGSLFLRLVTGAGHGCHRARFPARSQRRSRDSLRKCSGWLCWRGGLRPANMPCDTCGGGSAVYCVMHVHYLPMWYGSRHLSAPRESERTMKTETEQQLLLCRSTVHQNRGNGGP